ncbi:hypothetical protein RRG08_038639 [Elysia crispata]|uniref:Homeobox domain-containing protein n=1 Tax=Elysia crispata TaxID=231223 RepID=A0AAE0YLS1_9GAST|nr:hypothetical protein RRG08_038639 [Elysia crispata]
MTPSSPQELQPPTERRADETFLESRSTPRSNCSVLRPRVVLIRRLLSGPRQTKLKLPPDHSTVLPLALWYMSKTQKNTQNVAPCVGLDNPDRPGDVLDRDGYPHQTPRQKRVRTSFKHHQLRTMKSYFALNHNPDAKDLKQLAQKTGLSKRVLQNLVFSICGLNWDLNSMIAKTLVCLGSRTQQCLLGHRVYEQLKTGWQGVKIEEEEWVGLGKGEERRKDDHHKLTSLLTGQLQRLSRLVREDNSPSHPQCIAQVYVARSGYIPGMPCGQKTGMEHRGLEKLYQLSSLTLLVKNLKQPRNSNNSSWKLHPQASIPESLDSAVWAFTLLGGRLQ